MVQPHVRLPARRKKAICQRPPLQILCPRPDLICPSLHQNATLLPLNLSQAPVLSALSLQHFPACVTQAGLFTSTAYSSDCKMLYGTFDIWHIWLAQAECSSSILQWGGGGAQTGRRQKRVDLAAPPIECSTCLFWTLEYKISTGSRG